MKLKLKTTRKDIPGRDSLLVNFPVKSRYAEAYRTLRTNIYFSMMEDDLSSLLVTSSVPEEGKSITVANLAYTIAQTGKSVLMIDADLRKPGLSQRFGLKQATGLSNLIGDVLARHINKGAIEEYGLKDLVTLNSLQKRTCIMDIHNDRHECELLFVGGDLIDIYWKTRPDEKKLANVLMNEKLLTSSEAELALGYQKKSAGRLGIILRALGMVQEQELEKNFINSGNGSLPGCDSNEVW